MKPTPQPAPRQEFKEARDLAAEGRFSEAVERVSTVLAGGHDVAKGPGIAALCHVARVAGSRGNAMAAAHALETAARLAPGYADVHFQLAMVRLQLQQRREARGALERALRINPGYLAAKVELALLDAREGLIGESLDALRALGRDQRVEEPRTFREGLRSLQRADWDEAGSLLRRALRLGEPELEEVCERFHALMEEGEFQQAAQAIRDVMPQFQGYPDLHFLAATAELNLGHLDDALSSFSRALVLNPQFHAARIELARTLEALGQVDRAREQVHQVLELAPGEPRALEMLARWDRRYRRTPGSDNTIRKAS